MDANQAADRFVETFHRIYRRYQSRDFEGQYRISPESLAVLEHLMGTGPLTVSESARHFRRSQSAMSEIFTRLEKRALLERYPDQRDARRTLVFLTPDGIELWKRATRVLSVDRLAERFAQLDPHERTQLLAGLESLLESPEKGTP